MKSTELEQKGKTALRRIFWRMIYHEKKKRKRECPLLDRIGDPFPYSYETETRIHLSDLINSLPSPEAKYIIQKTVFEGFKEWEVACDLKISQQAVNKSKRKHLALLAKKLYP
jgi:DNA-directed RNA polymerase specialized sigma subunit, sigma24 homolog